MLTFLKFALLGYIALAGLIFLFQRNLMYHPARNIATPDVYGLTGIDEAFIDSYDGERLLLWQHAAKPGYPTIVYFHGNAANLADRAAKFSAFVDNGFGLVALSYRGFGKSTGTPTEAGIYNDARAVIDYTTHHFNTPPNRLIYFGESLGSGIAVQMACEQAPGLVVLEAAYTSVETRSAELYSFLIGVRYLVLDKYDSLSKIKDVHAPLLMLHGGKDITIPLRHGKILFEAANEPKRMVVYKDVHHTDYTNEQIVTPLMEEARKLGLIQTDRAFLF